MRLLNVSTLRVHEFLDDRHIPAYAILSHTWGEDECTLHDMNNPNAKSKAGYQKIEKCCRQAIKDRLDWTWVDT